MEQNFMMNCRVDILTLQLTKWYVMPVAYWHMNYAQFCSSLKAVKLQLWRAWLFQGLSLLVPHTLTDSHRRDKESDLLLWSDNKRWQLPITKWHGELTWIKVVMNGMAPHYIPKEVEIQESTINGKNFGLSSEVREVLFLWLSDH